MTYRELESKAREILENDWKTAKEYDEIFGQAAGDAKRREWADKADAFAELLGIEVLELI